jgi:hypothetical protein
VLYAYYDESNTHDGTTEVVIGGLLGSLAEWQAVESSWMDHHDSQVLE